jgi:hypothetical protein
MREWSAMLMGVALGVAATLYYLNNESQVKQKTRQIKARSRRAMDMVSNIGCTAERMLER